MIVVVKDGETTRRRQVVTELYTPHQKCLPLPTILLLHPHGIIYPRTEHTTMMPAEMMTMQQTTTSSYAQHIHNTLLAVHSIKT
jgi:hypothetical protein